MIKSSLKNLLFTLVFIFVIGTFSLPVLAQSCQYPPEWGAEFSWQSNSGISVNISSSFNSTQQQAIHDAFVSWEGNGCGVYFQSFTYNSTPLSGTGTYQISLATGNPCPITC